MAILILMNDGSAEKKQHDGHNSPRSLRRMGEAGTREEEEPYLSPDDHDCGFMGVCARGFVQTTGRGRVRNALGRASKEPWSSHGHGGTEKHLPAGLLIRDRHLTSATTRERSSGKRCSRQAAHCCTYLGGRHWRKLSALPATPLPPGA